MSEKLSNIKAIREFFSEGNAGRDVTTQEFKNLTSADREELGELCREALQESSPK